MKDNFYTVFNKLVKDEKVSKNKLSNETGIVRKSITSYLNGNSIPRYDNLSKIADYFEISSDYLLGLEEFDGLTYKTKCANKEIPFHFTQTLKNFMSEKGHSQYALAKILKIEQTTVSKWFKMKTMPDTDILVKLSQIYKCKVDELICRDIFISSGN